MRYERSRLPLWVLAVGVALVALGAAAAPVAADDHDKDNAVDVTDEANFTSTFPFRTDHYPGDQNEENGSIQYFFTPEESFTTLGIEDKGAFGDYLIIDATWIDYSACAVDNTAAFGIDRGNNDSGTKYDVDLVAKQKNADFRDDGITIEFYDWDDITNNPPYLRAQDAIVAEQGARSGAGACLTVTNDPGWYRIQGFLNGTAADNGPDERPSEDAETVAGIAFSNYIYVCECDSRQEAREELGPPPNEQRTATPTPATTTATATPTTTPTATATTTPTPADSTETATPAPTPTLSEHDPQTGTETPTGTDASGGSDDPDDLDGTPTPAEAPGFGIAVALLGLVGGGLLARRR
ncbi:PGF-CTERM sorting domain-containing protein [Natronomonas amylolytica]|uniref:PGF-CTERM sorting domain-containing protein n=1 Tax=Natronomonas amylolytica TaxID=3108498 RepID=UPI0030093DBF